MGKAQKSQKYKTKPPSGFSKIEPTLTKFNAKMKEAESRPIQMHRPKHESLWEVHQISHQRSRYVYELYYKKKIVSRELYEWLLKNKFADGDLIAKWKKQGYENLCCLRCIQTRENNQGTTCVCRVPKASFKESASGGETTSSVQNVRCMNCGCRGCASTD